MKITLLLFMMTALVFSASGSELPKRFIGRWSFDEAATANLWPAKGQNDEERARFKKIAEGFRSMREALGKSVIGFIDIDRAGILAHEGLMNPRFEMLSIEEKEGIALVRARHFQVPDDDNPKEVALRLGIVDEVLVFELWDDGQLMMLYALTRKNANSGATAQRDCWAFFCLRTPIIAWLISDVSQNMKTKTYPLVVLVTLVIFVSLSAGCKSADVSSRTDYSDPTYIAYDPMAGMQDALAGKNGPRATNANGKPAAIAERKAKKDLQQKLEEIDRAEKKQSAGS